MCVSLRDLWAPKRRPTPEILLTTYNAGLGFLAAAHEGDKRLLERLLSKPAEVFKRRVASLSKIIAGSRMTAPARDQSHFSLERPFPQFSRDVEHPRSRSDFRPRTDAPRNIATSLRLWS